MRRHPAGKPGRQPPPGEQQSKQPAALNPRLYAQTRKVLVKHYRTKYGVRRKRGGPKP